MMFRFTLDPIDDIEPWGSPPDLSLSWFGLSLGRYSIVADAFEVLRYSDAAVSAMRVAQPLCYPGPQVGYQVVRLHKDLLDIISDVLTPLPCDVAEVLNRQTAVATMRRAQALASGMEDNDPTLMGLEALVDCLGARLLDTAYLEPCPWILLWRHSDVIHMEWNGDGQTLYGVPAWQFPSGRIAIGVASYRSAVAKFHSKFTGLMSVRVAEIQAAWKRPEVHIDYAELIRSQKYREDQLDIALNRRPKAADWEAVKMGLGRCWLHAE